MASDSKKAFGNAERSRDFHVIVLEMHPNVGMHVGVKEQLKSVEEDA